MGSVRGGARPPSHTAYFVALGGILLLLLMLCCYFFYFCIKRVKELSQQPDSLTQPVAKAPAASATYPVQPVVRDSATAMAKLCKQLPAPTSKGDTVFPTSTSPEAQQTDTGELNPAAEAPDKVPAPLAGVIAHATPAVR